MSLSPSSPLESADPVLVERRGGVMVLTLNRPTAANAINAAVTGALDAVVTEAEGDPEVRCIVLTGAGRNFCSGSDLREFARTGGEGVFLDGKGFAGLAERRRTVPMIAAVNGAARAGGWEIALAADMVVAAESATFSFPEVRSGLIAGAGGIIRIGRCLPPAVAHQIMLTGVVLSARRAYELGLVTLIAPDTEVIDVAVALANDVALGSPDAVRITRDLVVEAPHLGTDEGWARNARAVAEIQRSPDLAEGLAAFLERRGPRWQRHHQA